MCISSVSAQPSGVPGPAAPFTLESCVRAGRGCCSLSPELEEWGRGRAHREGGRSEAAPECVSSSLGSGPGSVLLKPQACAAGRWRGEGETGGRGQEGPARPSGPPALSPVCSSAEGSAACAVAFWGLGSLLRELSGDTRRWGGLHRTTTVWPSVLGSLNQRRAQQVHRCT